MIVRMRERSADPRPLPRFQRARALETWEWPVDEASFVRERLVRWESQPFLCRTSHFFVAVKMNSMIYAWLCSLTVAFGGFMWGYEVG
jgi:hypothetical protein